MILTVSTRDDPTCDDVERKLNALGAEYRRINTEDLGTVASLEIDIEDQLSGQLSIGDDTIDISEIVSVYYRRPAPPEPSCLITDQNARHVARQEVDSLTRQFWHLIEDRFWISHPAAIRRAEHKLLQLREARRLGFHLPPTLITQDPVRARDFVASMAGEIAIKAISGVVIEGEAVSAVYTHKWQPGDEAWLDDVALCPTLLQAYVPKRSELRVTVVGRRAFACEMDTQADPKCAIDWRRGSALRFANRPFVLPEEVEWRCLELVQQLGLQYGAIDIIRTPEDNFVFLEINANGQFGWCEGLAGLPISQAIAQLLVGGKGVSA